jgi:LL-diaminopimelate aminotransferase
MKSNGPPYVIQKAAAAVYSPEGAKQVRALIEGYMANARVIHDGLTAAGSPCTGGATRPISGCAGLPDSPLGISSTGC